MWKWLFTLDALLWVKEVGHIYSWYSYLFRVILCALKTKIEIALWPTCFYVGYIIRRLLLLFSPGFFQDLKKINVGGGGAAGP